MSMGVLYGTWCTSVSRCAKYYHIGILRGLLRCSFNFFRQCEGLYAWDERQARFPRFFLCLGGKGILILLSSLLGVVGDMNFL